MHSIKMGRLSCNLEFDFSSGICGATYELHFAEKSIKIGLVVPEIWTIQCS